jgi:hypothetical protein
MAADTTTLFMKKRMDPKVDKNKRLHSPLDECGGQTRIVPEFLDQESMEAIIQSRSHDRYTAQEA